MILRKAVVFISSSILTSMIIAVIFMTEGFPNFINTFTFFILYVTPTVLVLGMPISIFSDVILQNNQGKSRFWGAFVIHIFFGLLIGIGLTYFSGGTILLVGSTIASIVVWAVDEFLKIMFKKEENIET
jgi:hypothetical protein